MLHGTGRHGRVEPGQRSGLVVGMVERVVLVIAVPGCVGERLVVMRVAVVIEGGVQRGDRVVRSRRPLRRREHGEGDRQGDRQMSKEGSTERQHTVSGWFPRAKTAILVSDRGAKLVGKKDGAVMVAKGFSFAPDAGPARRRLDFEGRSG
ncbi:hypothetical protein [Aurantimonas sp. VKM B-3413]|uniref:hypothetical protein n=1 Tax=Aurantimonas sp. VKM B-3413 TaxID=2779401 RepID=UPI001E5B6EA0|nr:hypothetical protein [Aurantimonas sp. VKM B-3413]MCB8837102.1 hypothetical protein [Aurantimonas sp. VKM B-3413]